MCEQDPKTLLSLHETNANKSIEACFPPSDRLDILASVTLCLTEGCNSRCTICTYWRNPRHDMPITLVDKILDDFKQLQVRRVTLTGGEPLQHPQWSLIAQRIREQGAQIHLMTNGILLERQRQAVLANVDDVTVSLDGGTSATYKAIRGVDAFDLVLTGIQAISAGGVPVRVRAVLQQANYHEIPQMIQVAKNAGASKITFQPLDLRAFGRHRGMPMMTLESDVIVNKDCLKAALTMQDISQFNAILDEVESRFAQDFAAGLISESPDQLRNISAYFSAFHGQNDFPQHHCNAPHVSVIVEVDGSLHPCFFLPSWGRVGETSFTTALNQSEALALRHDYRHGKRPECKWCVVARMRDFRTYELIP